MVIIKYNDTNTHNNISSSCVKKVSMEFSIAKKTLARKLKIGCDFRIAMRPGSCFWYS